MSTMLEKVNYIADIKTDLGTAITNKGGSVTNDFDSYATAITNIPSGGGGSLGPACLDFRTIGYGAEEVAGLNAEVAYSKLKLDEWNPENTTADKLYENDKSLVYVPLIDTSNVTTMSWMFYGCSSLTSIPQLDTSKVTNMDSMFYGCSSLTSIPQLDTSKVTNMNSMFYNCKTFRELPYLNTESVKTFNTAFGQDSTYIRKINELSLKSATSIYDLFGYNQSWGSDFSVVYMLLKDLGASESLTYYPMSKCAHWGDETYNDPYGDPIPAEIDLKGAAQTVVDSLLTYSFDRAAAGYANCKLECHTNMKQYLTEEQITAIQNKGYTITF